MQLKDAVGRFGEAIAARFLVDSGYQLLDRNWRCARGEIDIIASQGRLLVFCEVKTRSSLAFGQPAEAVGRVKAQRLRTLSLQWLAENPGGWDGIRFDVISVLRRPAGPAQVHHLPAAF